MIKNWGKIQTIKAEQIRLKYIKNFKKPSYVYFKNPYFKTPKGSTLTKSLNIAPLIYTPHMT